MSKHTITGFVHYSKDSWDNKASYEVFPFDMSKTSEGKVLIGEQAIEIEVPDDFNPVPKQLAILEEQKRLLRLKLSHELARIDERISKLTCIEQDVETA